MYKLQAKSIYKIKTNIYFKRYNFYQQAQKHLKKISAAAAAAASNELTLILFLNLKYRDIPKKTYEIFLECGFKTVIVYI